MFLHLIILHVCVHEHVCASKDSLQEFLFSLPYVGFRIELRSSGSSVSDFTHWTISVAIGKYYLEPSMHL